MDRLIEPLTDTLRRLIHDLGEHEGLIGPSIYDTAMVLRLAPPAEGVEAGLNWLQEQQQPDGGWGEPQLVRERDIPTLAALLTLHIYGVAPRAVSAGIAFLRRTSARWVGPVPIDIPLAAELIIPRLINEARQHGLDVPESPYAALSALGARRRQMLTKLNPRPGSAAMHSWEAWGTDPDAELFDETNSVGHSPAATAAWLAATEGREDLAGLRSAATTYLANASTVTGVDIPGVVPTVWPYARNEQSVAMFAVYINGLFEHPELQDVVATQVADMAKGLRPTGQGISDQFSTDGDITAMVLTMLKHCGYEADPALMTPYIVEDSCLTYPNELQRSFSATTHAAHALADLGQNACPLLDYLQRHRTSDGRWANDKWHASWLYLTSHTIHALVAAGQHERALEALPALLAQQHEDGCWGVTPALAEETAYGVTAMLGLARAGLLTDEGRQALDRAGYWLCRNFNAGQEHTGACWAAKEPYRPRRISHTIEVSATLAWVLEAQAFAAASLVREIAA